MGRSIKRTLQPRKTTAWESACAEIRMPSRSEIGEGFNEWGSNSQMHPLGPSG